MAIVGLIFGGRSVEHKVSIKSARTVSRALREVEHTVVPFGIAQDGCWVDEKVSLAALEGEMDLIAAANTRVASTLDRLLHSAAEVMFPIVHGTWGEDGTLQGFLEVIDLPYVGADVAASAVAMDKVICKRILQQAEIPVVDFKVVRKAHFDDASAIAAGLIDELGLPMFVKPSIGGSSVGITRVDRTSELDDALRLAFRFDDVALVEKAIQGRELECSVLGLETFKASAIGEIVPSSGFYDYADKYLRDEAELVAPADLSREIVNSIQDMATRAFAAINGNGMARVDFFLDDNARIYVNEINTAPGFTNISMYPRLWEVSGLALPELVDRLIGIALERHRSRGRLSQEIDSWLMDLDA